MIYGAFPYGSIEYAGLYSPPVVTTTTSTSTSTSSSSSTSSSTSTSSTTTRTPETTRIYRGKIQSFFIRGGRVITSS